VLSAAVPLSSEQHPDKQDSSVATGSKEDYDEVHSIEKTSEPSVADTKPPLVFPESDSDQSKTSKNETALGILQSAVIVTEVFKSSSFTSSHQITSEKFAPHSHTRGAIS
jgi:hypothetical protein